MPASATSTLSCLVLSYLVSLSIYYRLFYTVHLWLVGKRVVDVLLVLIELFASSHG